MSNRYDLIIIGGGVVGLATAYQLLLKRPGISLAVVEKEGEVASHQSDHNSGVLHAGLYYTPGTRKARLCREGKTALQVFAEAHGVPFDLCGKLVIALNEAELPQLASVKERALANGVPELAEIGPERMREIEPHAAGIRALWSPQTGIISFRAAALAYAQEIELRGGTILTDHRVTAIEQRPDEQVVRTVAGEYLCRDIISCAGLYSDRVAAMTGAAGTERIVPFRGDFYTLSPEAGKLVNGLIYPVPDPRFPFLGVHLTKTIDGRTLAGPNAVLAFKREGYHRTDLSIKDLGESLAFKGFRKLARKYWRTGLAEMYRDWSKRAFTADLARYLPEIRAQDLTFGPSGVRAMAVSADGAMVDDFSFGESPHVIHVRNAPSPAATASLAIGRELAEMAIDRFTLS